VAGPSRGPRRLERETIPRLCGPPSDRTASRPGGVAHGTARRGRGRKPEDGRPPIPDDGPRSRGIPRFEGPGRYALGRRFRRLSRRGPGPSTEIAAFPFNPPQEFLGGFVFGVYVEGLTQGPSRFLAEAFLEVHPRQVRVGVEVAAISRRGDRPLEPGNRFIEAFELDQVRPDIVVRIPERRVHFDRA